MTSPQTADKPNSQAMDSLKGKKVAFISVFDKTGIEPVARALVEKYGYAILSTGGTKKFLDEKGIPSVESSEITGFQELLGGRVKSLHPEIFAGILAERHNESFSEHKGLKFLIDTVMVNLYPFEQERAQFGNGLVPGKDPLDLLHMIDIGGSSLIRAAAKNFLSVNVLAEPAQYDAFLAELEAGHGQTRLEFRKKLAYQAFQRSVSYDAQIAAYFAEALDIERAEDESYLDDTLVLPLLKIQTLRYGENPHQQAALYGVAKRDVDFTYLQGKELSYNNILDMEAAWRIVTEFADLPVCAIIKHNNPCGVATSHRSVADAYQTAFDCDPLSAFGGVVAFNATVDIQTARQMKEVFLEVIIAPAFEPEALEILAAKKNLRLVTRPFEPAGTETALEARQVNPELFLVQHNDPAKETRVEQLLTLAGEVKPTEQQLQDLVFAWKVAKHVKSNAIVLAKEGRTVGIGGGQTSRIGALEQALKVACEQATDAVMASDGFLPAVDNIHAAAQSRIAAIIQPGGSIKDADVLNLANQNGIAMVTTGIREFRH